MGEEREDHTRTYQNVLVERPPHDEVEGPLLAVVPKGKEGAFVLVHEELEGGDVLEGPHVVLAVEHLGVGLEELRLGLWEWMGGWVSG